MSSEAVNNTSFRTAWDVPAKNKNYKPARFEQLSKKSYHDRESAEKVSLR